MDKPNIWKSRKFWITVVDSLVSIITMLVTLRLDPDNAKFVLGVIASLQPVIYALINGIATEDAASTAAAASVKVAETKLDAG